MQMFAAHYRFDASCGQTWANYIQWSGFDHISEIVSTDEMLCPGVVEELADADWQHNIQEDYRAYFFRDFEYLRRRIDYDSRQHNLLAIIDRPASPVVAEDDFQFCGYDILDSYDSTSVLTNCGPFPEIFQPGEVNRYGLLDDLARASEIAAALRSFQPHDPHCIDCRVWSLCRYVGAA